MYIVTMYLHKSSACRHTIKQKLLAVSHSLTAELGLQRIPSSDPAQLMLKIEFFSACVHCKVFYFAK